MYNQPTLVQLGQFVFQIGDLINAGLLGLAILSLWITFHNIRQGNRVRRASFFKEAYLAAFAEPAMLDALGIIERNRFHATIEHGAIEENYETQVNALLGFANSVCAMHKFKLMSKRELEPFTYLFLVLYRNEEVQRYYLFLEWWTPTKMGDRQHHPYHYWMHYCRHVLGQPKLDAAKLASPRDSEAMPETGETVEYKDDVKEQHLGAE